MPRLLLHSRGTLAGTRNSSYHGATSRSSLSVSGRGTSGVGVSSTKLRVSVFNPLIGESGLYI